MRDTGAFCGRGAWWRTAIWWGAWTLSPKWVTAGAFVCELRRWRRDGSTYFTPALAQPAVEATVAAKQLHKVGDELAWHFLPLVKKLVTLACDPLLNCTYLLFHCTHLCTDTPMPTTDNYWYSRPTKVYRYHYRQDYHCHYYFQFCSISFNFSHLHTYYQPTDITKALTDYSRV